VFLTLGDLVGATLLNESPQESRGRELGRSRLLRQRDAILLGVFSGEGIAGCCSAGLGLGPDAIFSLAVDPFRPLACTKYPVGDRTA
jgi:hypothetical protein